MKINIVAPKWYKEMNGFNEVVQEEVAAYIRANFFNVDLILTQELPIYNADIYLFVAQYREEARGEWLNSSTKKCKTNSIIGVCGKATTEARKFILMKTNKINFVIKGEAEITFGNIISQFIVKGSVDFSTVNGIIYRDENGNLLENHPQNCIIDYDTLPMPNFSYLKYGMDKYPICVLSSSRGCHGECKFCEGYICRTLNPGPVYRAKSAERVFEEIKYVVNKYNYRIFSFSDDNFMVDGIKGKERALEFARKLRDNRLRIRYTIECRADDIDKEVFLELKKSGLHKAFIGIESGSQSFLDRIGKNTTVEQNTYAIDTLLELGIGCEPGYIFFDPFTTKNELKDTLSFFKKYQDHLYSLPTGDGYCRLYFPYESEIIKLYWPQADIDFYNNMSQGKIDYPFYNTDVSCIFNKYVSILKQKNICKQTMLKTRLSALEAALENFK